jgi:hypothetical protein
MPSAYDRVLVTVPTDLRELYQRTAKAAPKGAPLPTVSSLLVEAMHRELRARGIEPPPMPPPSETAAATAAAAAKRQRQRRRR